LGGRLDDDGGETSTDTLEDLRHDELGVGTQSSLRVDHDADCVTGRGESVTRTAWQGEQGGWTNLR
jgi:hypothetical protein